MRLRVIWLPALLMALAAAPAHAASQATGVFSHNANGTLTLTVTNPTGEQVDSAEFRLNGAYVVASSTGPGGACTNGGGTPGYTLCGLVDIPAGQSRTINVTPFPAPYADNGGGSLGVYSFSECNPCFSAVTGPAPLPVTPAPETPPPVTPTPAADPVPVQDQTAVITPIGGTVLARPPGGKTFSPVSTTQVIKDGTEIDTRNGTARIRVAQDKSGTSFGTATVSRGLAIVDQMGPLTQLRLSEKLTGCGKQPVRQSVVTKKPKKRQLFTGSTDKFQTRGNFAAGTVRGTQWMTTDTCDTTWVKTIEHVVSVRDFVKNKTVSVKAGQKYTAHAEER